MNCKNLLNFIKFRDLNFTNVFNIIVTYRSLRLELWRLEIHYPLSFYYNNLLKFIKF